MIDIELRKQKGDYLIIDSPTGETLITIHSSEWSCTKEETKEYVKAIFKIVKKYYNWR